MKFSRIVCRIGVICVSSCHDIHSTDRMRLLLKKSHIEFVTRQSIQLGSEWHLSDASFFLDSKEKVTLVHWGWMEFDLHHFLSFYAVGEVSRSDSAVMQRSDFFSLTLPCRNFLLLCICIVSDENMKMKALFRSVSLSPSVFAWTSTNVQNTREIIQLLTSAYRWFISDFCC